MAVGIGEGAVVALLHRRCEYPDGTRGGLSQTVPFIGYEKERLVLAVIQLRYKDRSAEAPNSLRTRWGGFVKKSVRARATPMPLLRAVSKSAPCSSLVPDFVLIMKDPGRSIWAEELLVSDRNSATVSNPGWR